MFTMEIIIQLPEEKSKQGVIHLKNFIDRASIEGLERTEIQRAVHENGQMGAGDILGSVCAVIAASGPLVELVKCLVGYANNYRTVITIPTKNGNIELKYGRSMTPEELKQIITAIQASNSVV